MTRHNTVQHKQGKMTLRMQCVSIMTVVALTTILTEADDKNCLCVTERAMKIYSGPEVSREVIGLAIRGECLPVAHTNDEGETWVSVDFKKNIIFHQLHLIGYIMKDSNVVYSMCSGGQNFIFVTTTEPFISHSSSVTEQTTTEELLSTTTETTTTATTNIATTEAATTWRSTSSSYSSSNTRPTMTPATVTLTYDVTTDIQKATMSTEATKVSETSTSYAQPTSSETITPSHLPDGMTSSTTTHSAADTPTPHQSTSESVLTTDMFSTTMSTSISTLNTTHTCDLQCLNGGSCVTDPVTSCLCAGGWNGDSCEVCVASDCNHGDCVVVGTTQSKCVCDPGYTGISCNDTHTCNTTEVSIGGECYTFHYEYESCQENYCVTQPGTECLVNSEGVYCLCKEEFDPRETTPCGCPSGHVTHLNGSCVEINCRGVTSCSHGQCYFRSFYNYGCLCDPGWEGESCDLAITQCGSDYCYNNGICGKDPDTGCNCTGAWTGPGCNVCGAQPCRHGACVLDQYHQPRCICDKEYGGPVCDQRVMDCLGQQYGGHCYGNDLDNFSPCMDDICLTGELCVAALHTIKNDLYCVCKENVTESYLTSDCGCPPRSLRNYRGQCVDLLLQS